MTRTQQQEAKYTQLVQEMCQAEQRANWFWCSGGHQRKAESARRKMSEYDAKYGPFTLVVSQ